MLRLRIPFRLGHPSPTHSHPRPPPSCHPEYPDLVHLLYLRTHSLVWLSSVSSQVLSPSVSSSPLILIMSHPHHHSHSPPTRLSSSFTPVYSSQALLGQPPPNFTLALLVHHHHHLLSLPLSPHPSPSPTIGGPFVTVLISSALTTFVLVLSQKPRMTRGVKAPKIQSTLPTPFRASSRYPSTFQPL